MLISPELRQNRKKTGSREISLKQDLSLSNQSMLGVGRNLEEIIRSVSHTYKH